MHQSLVDALMQNIGYSNRSHQVGKEIMIEAKYTMFWKNKEARKMDGHPNSLSGSLIITWRLIMPTKYILHCMKDSINKTREWKWLIEGALYGWYD